MADQRDARRHAQGAARPDRLEKARYEEHLQIQTDDAKPGEVGTIKLADLALAVRGHSYRIREGERFASLLQNRDHSSRRLRPIL